MADAPEKIWVWQGAGRHFVSAPEDHYPPSATEYIRSDVAQAMVAAAYEAMNWIVDNPPAHARAALDALLKAEREKALREAAKAAGNIAVDALKDEEPSASLVRLQFRRRAFESKILALIDKDKADG